MIPNLRRIVELGIIDHASLQYLLSSEVGAQEDFASYLRQMGTHPNVAEAFRRIDRAKFVPEEFRRVHWVNESIPISYHTWLSAPGIVSLMLDMCFAHRPNPKKVVEVGSGTGFHLACARMLFPSAELIGYEADLASVEIARDVTRGYDISFFHATTPEPDKGVELVFCTFCGSEDTRTKLFDLFPAATIVCPSIIDRLDFVSVISSGGSFLGFKSFEEYLAQPESFQKISAWTSHRQPSSEVFDVRFVTEVKAPIFNSDLRPVESALERFTRWLYGGPPPPVS